MNAAVNIVLGILDVFALFALMYKTFRLPYKEYLTEISIISVAVSLLSFVLREVLKLPSILDIVLHWPLYIIFLRYLIKIRVWRAFIVSLTYFGYGALSFIVYTIYSKLGAFQIDSGDIAPVSIQITQIIAAFLIAYLLHYTGFGFKFIIRPPHDFIIKAVMTKKDRNIMIATAIVGIISFVCFTLVLDYKLFQVIPLILIGFIILIYLGYRRDMQ